LTSWYRWTTLVLVAHLLHAVTTAAEACSRPGRRRRGRVDRLHAPLRSGAASRGTPHWSSCSLRSCTRHRPRTLDDAVEPALNAFDVLSTVCQTRPGSRSCCLRVRPRCRRSLSRWCGGSWWRPRWPAATCPWTLKTPDTLLESEDGSLIACLRRSWTVRRVRSGVPSRPRARWTVHSRQWRGTRWCPGQLTTRAPGLSRQVRVRPLW